MCVCASGRQWAERSGVRVMGGTGEGEWQERRVAGWGRCVGALWQETKVHFSLKCTSKCTL